MAHIGTRRSGAHRLSFWLALTALLGGPLAVPARGDEFWRQAKAYTASIAELYEDALQTLADAKEHLETAQQVLQAAEMDLATAGAAAPPALAGAAANAASAVAAAQTAVTVATQGVVVAAALATAFAAGTGVGQGIDYLISWCWDPPCPLDTATGTYELPTNAEIDAWIEAVIANGTGTTLTQADFALADLYLPGSGTASWAYLRAGVRNFAIALRGASAFTVGNCPDLLRARDDLQVGIAEFIDAINGYAPFLEAGATYSGDPTAAIVEATAALDALEPLVPQFPDPAAMQAAIDLARAGLADAQAQIDRLSEGMGDPQDEGFDAYPAGTGIRGRGEWTTWNDDPAFDTPVTNAICRSIANALDVYGPADIVHRYPSHDTGVWSCSAWQYIPSGFSSNGTGQFAGTYFMLLNTYEHGGPHDWSVQMQFDSNDGMLKVYYGDGLNTVNVPYAPDRWVKVEAVIDLDLDWTQVYYDDILIAEYSWTGGVLGGGTGLPDIAAVDLFANGATSVYYDDVVLERLGGETLPRTLDGEHGVFDPLTLEEFHQFLADCAAHGAAALPALEVNTVNTMMDLLGGTYAGIPDLAPAIAEWDGWGDTGNESALFGPTGRLLVSEVLTTAIDNHWVRIDLAESPLVQACGPPCPADVNGDRVVDVLDLLALLSRWGPCPACPEDINGDGDVNVLDLLEVLAAWGPCS